MALQLVACRSVLALPSCIRVKPISLGIYECAKTYHSITEALLPLKFGALPTQTSFLLLPSFGDM